MLGLLALVVGVGAAQQWWVGHHSAAIGEQVAALAAPGDIRMMASDTCGICAVARGWFATHGISYSECSIERDAACRAAFEATLSPGTPVIVVRGRPHVGFSPESVRDALQRPV